MSPLDLTGEQKAIVEEFGSEMFVSAGAGSGKTSVVIEGFIDVLQRGLAEIDEILTITFTEKAAGQMMRKAREELAARGMHEERRQVENAHISTIHGFCSGLIRKHALALGLDPQFKVADEAQSELLKEESFRECLERFVLERGREGVELVFNFDRNLSGGLFKIVGSLHDELRSRGIAMPDFELPAINLETAVAELLRSIDDAFDALEEAGSDAPQVRRKLRDLQEALAVRDPRERIRLILGIRPSRNCGARDAIEEVLRRRRDYISAAHVPVVTMLRELLRSFSREYADGKRRSGLLDFEDLQLEAKRLLDTDSEVRDRVASGFKLIVIDEFQDTNGLQCKIIERIARDNVCYVGDEKQSIYRFRHADVELFKEKRRAAARLDRVRPLSTNFRSQEEILSFVDLIFSSEDMLGGEGYMKMSAGAEQEAGAEAPRVEVILVDGDSAVQVKANAPVTKAAEAELVSLRLRELYDSGKEHEPGGTAILLRKKADAELFREALDRQGIPNYLSIGRDYYFKMELGDAMSLMKILVNPLDDAALLGVLRSPMVGMNDDSLVMFRQFAGMGDRKTGPPPLWATVTYEGTSDKLPPAQAERLRNFLDDYEGLRILARRQTLERTVRMVIEYHDYAAIAAAGPEGRSSFANLLKLVDLAVDFEAAWGRDLAAFVEFLVEQQEREVREGDAPTEAEGSGSVQILTIHTAKGLEFPLVVWGLMGGEMQHRNNDLVVGEDGSIGFDYRLLGDKDRRLFDYERIDESEQERGLEEEKRIGYVAMTRAKRRLILCGTSNVHKQAEAAASRKPIEWVRQALQLDPEHPEFADLGDELSPDARSIVLRPEEDCPLLLTVCTDPTTLVNTIGESAAAAADIKVESVDAELLGFELPQARYVPATISPSAFSTYHKCPRRYYLELDLQLTAPDDTGGGGAVPGKLPGHHMGSLVHRVLELAPLSPRVEPDSSPDHLNEILARDLGLDLPLDDEDQARAARLLGALETMPVAEKLSAAEAGGNLFREHPFSTLLGVSIVNGMIDVLCRNESGEGALVVDYKTDALAGEDDLQRAAEHHAPQMAAYAVAASRMGWGFPVAVSLVFLDRERAEVTRRYSEADIAAAEQELMGLIDAMGDGSFRPLDAVDIRFCPGCAGFKGNHKLCATAAKA